MTLSVHLALRCPYPTTTCPIYSWS